MTGGNHSSQSRGFDSHPAKTRQSVGSESSMTLMDIGKSSQRVMKRLVDAQNFLGGVFTEVLGTALPRPIG